VSFVQRSGLSEEQGLLGFLVQIACMLQNWAQQSLVVLDQSGWTSRCQKTHFKPEWHQIFQPSPSRPVYNVQIHVPEGVKIPGY